MLAWSGVYAVNNQYAYIGSEDARSMTKAFPMATAWALVRFWHGFGFSIGFSLQFALLLLQPKAQSLKPEGPKP